MNTKNLTELGLVTLFFARMRGNPYYLTYTVENTFRVTESPIKSKELVLLCPRGCDQVHRAANKTGKEAGKDTNRLIAITEHISEEYAKELRLYYQDLSMQYYAREVHGQMRRALGPLFKSFILSLRATDLYPAS